MMGFNNEVVEASTDRFDGCIVELGSLKFQVIEQYIVVATSLPMYHEIWFKNKCINANYNHFFKEKHQDPNWKKRHS